MKLLKHIPSWLKSKYLIAGVSFIVWMSFFDRNDVTLQWKRISELRKLQQSEKVMNLQIFGTKSELEWAAEYCRTRARAAWNPEHKERSEYWIKLKAQVADALAKVNE